MANNYQGKMLCLKGNVIAVSIGDQAMVIDFNKSPKKHFTLSPDSGCFMLELLVRSKKGEEVTFEEMVDCVQAQFNFTGSSDTPENGVTKFLDLLKGHDVLEHKNVQKPKRPAPDIIKNITGKGVSTPKAWTAAGPGGGGSWIGGFPTWYP